MENIRVKAGQNIIDIALQYYGTAEAVFDLAQDNQLALSEVLLPGQVVQIDKNKIVRAEIVRYYQENQIMVATGNELEARKVGDFGFDFNFDFGSDFNV